MTRRFSAQELYNVRNHIPISALIENVLNMPTRTTEGVFRFLCPVCGEFNTAVNLKTNLARCFSCEKNFNTIDLVMIAEKMNFVEAVRFLKTQGNFKAVPALKKPKIVVNPPNILPTSFDRLCPKNQVRPPRIH